MFHQEEYSSRRKKNRSEVDDMADASRICDV
jgi:hypothetical protein